MISPKKPIIEANNLIQVWRTAFASTPIDLKELFTEIVLPQSGNDNCSIVESDFGSFEGVMIKRPEFESDWVIGVNNNLIDSRKRFTLAHEIGHFILHRNLQEEFRCTFADICDLLVNKLETEANEFAGQLLLPPDVVRNFDEEVFSYTAVQQLSAKLNVSLSAAAFRLVSLSRRSCGFAISRDGFIVSGRASKSAYKAGLFFRQGTEIRSATIRNSLENSPQLFGMKNVIEFIDNNNWGTKSPAREENFFTRSGDYVYTFIELLDQ